MSTGSDIIVNSIPTNSTPINSIPTNGTPTNGTPISVPIVNNSTAQPSITLNKPTENPNDTENITVEGVSVHQSLITEALCEILKNTPSSVKQISLPNIESLNNLQELLIKFNGFNSDKQELEMYKKENKQDEISKILSEHEIVIKQQQHPSIEKITKKLKELNKEIETLTELEKKGLHFTQTFQFKQLDLSVKSIKLVLEDLEKTYIPAIKKVKANTLLDGFDKVIEELNSQINCCKLNIHAIVCEYFEKQTLISDFEKQLEKAKTELLARHHFEIKQFNFEKIVKLIAFCNKFKIDRFDCIQICHSCMSMLCENYNECNIYEQGSLKYNIYVIVGFFKNYMNTHTLVY